jgi:hypothetical protein
MKKFFIALSMLAALFLTVAPSQALVGMPDDVPGALFIQGFFVVEAWDEGTTTQPTSGLDTLVIFQHVGTSSASIPHSAGAAINSLHWVLRDVNSNHLKDDVIPYTEYDVEGISMRDIIWNYTNLADRTALRMTFNGVEYFIGYMDYEKSAQDVAAGYWNDLVAKIYLVDMLAGKACMSNLPAKEFMDPTLGWLSVQYQQTTIGVNDAEFVGNVAPPAGGWPYEAFSPNAVAASEQRERSAVALVAPAATTAFRLMPRYYLHDSIAQNYLFLWKSDNLAGGFTWQVRGWLYDNEELGISATIPLPDELNILDIRNWLPSSWLLTGYPVAGWIDIPFPGPANVNAFGNNWMNMEFLGYNWQLASNQSATLNWSGLNQVPRQVWWTGKTF